MAVNLSDQKLYMSIPIAKMEEVDDGIMVYGRASDGRVDSDDQVVAPEWSGEAIKKWLDTGGNVRVQHNPQLLPAGKGVSVEIDRDGDGAHWVKSLIVEPTAMKLVRHGVLRAYSVGIARPTIKRDLTGKARGGIVTGGEVAEISLVDRPANDGCGITLVKSAGDAAPWTHGDLVDLLVKAEAAALLTKGDGAKVPEQDNADDGDDHKPDAAEAQDEPVQDQEPDADEDDEGEGEGKPEDTQKAYAAARADWMAREPKAAPTDLGTGTAFLAKQAAMAAWEAWDAEGDQWGLNGTSAGYQTWLTKRNVDPDVGGGVDRDALAAEDFIDPQGRRFPIHTPGDVSDAVSSYGRAKPLIPLRKFRARLKAIARRKGPEFEAALPESWAGKNITLSSPNSTGLVPYNLQGQQEPFAGAHHHRDEDDEDEKDEMVEADLTKGGAMGCKRCGADLTAGVKRCGNCGKKIPKMLRKAASATLTKAVHNWSHGWVWHGAGPNPRLHGHMAEHHKAMSEGRFKDAHGHITTAAMAARAGGDHKHAAELEAHAGDIAANSGGAKGKVTAAQAKMHGHLAEAHRAAASGDAAGVGHHVSEAEAGKKRLERRHGAGKTAPEKTTQTDTGGWVGREEAGRMMYGDRGYEARTGAPVKNTGKPKTPRRSAADRELQARREMWTEHAHRDDPAPVKATPAKAAPFKAPRRPTKKEQAAAAGLETAQRQRDERLLNEGRRSDPVADMIADAKVPRPRGRAGFSDADVAARNRERGLIVTPTVAAPSAQSLASSRYARQAEAERAAVSQGQRAGGNPPLLAHLQGLPKAQIRRELQRRSHNDYADLARHLGIEDNYISHASTAPLIESIVNRIQERKRGSKSFNGGIMAKNDTTAVEAEAADAPYTAQRMHDALCPAYDWPAVTKAYPGLTGIADAINPDVFTDAILKAADDGDTDAVAWAGVLQDNANVIAAGRIEPALLADARAELVEKGFGPPPQPDQYQRGYIGAGHAPLSAPAHRVPMIPPSAHTIDPDDFHRGLLTEGHEAESPSDHGDNNPTGSTASGMARSFYATASRATAGTTMKALHDHLMDTIPGMCPMADSRPVMPPNMHATNRPHPTDPAAIAHATKAYSGGDGYYNEDGLTSKKVRKLITKAVTKATKTYQQEIDILREEIDELGAQPDPTAAPIRGAVTVAKAQTTAPVAVPVERISLVEQAQQSRAADEAEYIAFLQKTVATSDSPSMREQAQGVLANLLTKSG
jgi:hypothetical protein